MIFWLPLIGTMFGALVVLYQLESSTKSEHYDDIDPQQTHARADVPYDRSEQSSDEDGSIGTPAAEVPAEDGADSEDASQEAHMHVPPPASAPSDASAGADTDPGGDGAADADRGSPAGANAGEQCSPGDCVDDGTGRAARRAAGHGAAGSSEGEPRRDQEASWFGIVPGIGATLMLSSGLLCIYAFSKVLSVCTRMAARAEPVKTDPCKPPSETAASSKPGTPPSKTAAPSEPGTPPSETATPSEPGTPPSKTAAPSEPGTPPSKTAAPEPGKRTSTLKDDLYDSMRRAVKRAAFSALLHGFTGRPKDQSNREHAYETAKAGFRGGAEAFADRFAEAQLERALRSMFGTGMFSDAGTQSSPQ